MHHIIVNEYGGPDVLKYMPLSGLQPGADEVLVENKAIGVNYIDVYHRTGLYPIALPSGIGLESAGIITEIGSDVTDLAVGDRVATAIGSLGAYATHRLAKSYHLVKLPDHVDFETAAAVMLKGMTCEYLLHRCFPVSRGMTVLFHAIAGGVGSLACQWLKQLGVTVIGTAGSAEKIAYAQSIGCDHAINYATENVAERVREITHGDGVPVVFDSVGRATFQSSIDSLSIRGTLVSFGNASGPVEPFALALLAQKGALYVTRPALAHYVTNPVELELSTSTLFNILKQEMRVRINQRFDLADARAAHQTIERRESIGSNILLP
ncbi:MAG: quinone oxidoreductase [Actinomycetia bacterium]|nr:quinone oxidoreductase [Actinomycetes bacterium]